MPCVALHASVPRGAALLLSFVFCFFFIAYGWTRAWKNERRGIRYKEEMNKDHGEPRLFYLLFIPWFV